MSKRKRNIKSSLGHDPFESMTDFEIEGPAPSVVAERTVAAPKPQVQRTFRKVDVSNDKPKAFAIADFFTSLMNPVAESATAVEEESLLEDEDDQTAVEKFVPEDFGVLEQLDASDLEATLMGETAVEAVDFEETESEAEVAQATADMVDEVDLSVEEVIDEDEDDEDEPEFLMAKLAEPATPDAFAEVSEEFLDESSYEADEADEYELLDDDFTADTEQFSYVDELPETAALTLPVEVDEDEWLDDDFTADTEQFSYADELPETAALALPHESADEVDEVDEDEDDIFPTAAELRGILDTAELALTEEHRLVLDFEDDGDEDGDDTIIWGTTSELDPDLDFEWQDDSEEAEQDLPSWLTNTTSSEKFATDSLKPLRETIDTPIVEPDLGLSWEEDTADTDEALPNWLTAETAASKIDTDKLNPAISEEMDLHEDGFESDTSSADGAILEQDETESFTSPLTNDALTSDLWLEDDTPEPDWLTVANEKYADDADDEDDNDDLIETPDWLLPDADLETTEIEDTQDETPMAAGLNGLNPNDSAQLSSSLLNNWLENSAHDAEEEEPSWLVPVELEEDDYVADDSFDDINEDEVIDDASAEDDLSELFPSEISSSWEDSPEDDNQYDDDDDDEAEFSFDTAELTLREPTAESQTDSVTSDDADDGSLPEWIGVDDSFALFEGELDETGFSKDDVFDLASEVDEETTSDSTSAELFATTDQSNVVEIDFDFGFYEAAETESEPAAELLDEQELFDASDIAFDVADFAFDALEDDDTAVDEINPNLDEILERFSTLPETQILSPSSLEALQKPETDLLDFGFDEFQMPDEAGSDTAGMTPDLEQLVNRLATLPVTQPLQLSDDNPIDLTFANETESQVLEGLLKQIDAEMGISYPEVIVKKMTQPLPKSSPLGDASPLNISQGQFVVFMIGGIGYAFPLNQVEEITQPPQTDSVPNVPGWVLGTAKVNDTALPVIDLRRFFRIRSHTKPALERLLVVHNATEKTRAGLIVDEVKAIRSIPNGEITPLKDSIQVNPTVRPYTYGHYDKIILLDIDRLFNSSDMAHIGLKASS